MVGVGMNDARRLLFLIVIFPCHAYLSIDAVTKNLVQYDYQVFYPFTL